MTTYVRALRCKVCACHTEDRWVWHPFGPDDGIVFFLRPGYHYRGFPSISVCPACKAAIEAGEPRRVKYRGVVYLAADHRIEEEKR